MAQATEMWKPVVGFERSYEISDAGKLRSLPRPYVSEGRAITPTQNKSGYYHVQLSEAGRTRQVRVHRLVCEAFNEGGWDGAHVAHLNGDKSDNRAVNLAWAEPRDNAVHRVVHRAKRQPEGRNLMQVPIARMERVARHIAGEDALTDADRGWFEQILHSALEDPRSAYTRSTK